MQHFKDKFSDRSYNNTFFNVQKCLRLNDLKEIDDNSHYLTFHMLGMYSFREVSLQEAIKFWLIFTKSINNYPDYITIHPDKKEWIKLYPIGTDIRYDEGCIWSDGSIGGYCTEFYKNDIEIGNIVNTLGDCIDVGFGSERLLFNMCNFKKPNRLDILSNTIQDIIQSGIKINNQGHGYILKKLMTEFVLLGGILDCEEFFTVRKNQILIYNKYLKMVKKEKYKKKGMDWWLDTIGVDIQNLDKYNRL